MNLNETPPNGWMFYQSQTGWHMPHPVGVTHDQAVNLIIKHRQANPAIVTKHKLPLDFASVSRELVLFQQARGALPRSPDPKPTPPSSSPPLAGAVVAAVANIKKLASGAALLLQWEESNQPPVSAELSSKRAATCTQCPRNESAGLSKYFTGPIADNIRARLGRLHAMHLTTPSDAQLGVCSACLCVLSLKVHCPLDLLVKAMKPEVRADLHPDCWIIKADA
jgi:hypothetical protein